MYEGSFFLDQLVHQSVLREDRQTSEVGGHHFDLELRPCRVKLTCQLTNWLPGSIQSDRQALLSKLSYLPHPSDKSEAFT